MPRDDVVEVWRGGRDIDAEALRSSLAEAGVESRIVFGKRVWIGSTPTIVYVRGEDYVHASAIAQALHDAGGPRTYEDNWRYMLAAGAIVSGLFAVVSLSGGSPWKAVALGVVSLGCVAGAIVSARRNTACKTGPY